MGEKKTDRLVLATDDETWERLIRVADRAGRRTVNELHRDAIQLFTAAVTVAAERGKFFGYTDDLDKLEACFNGWLLDRTIRSSLERGQDIERRQDNDDANAGDDPPAPAEEPAGEEPATQPRQPLAGRGRTTFDRLRLTARALVASVFGR